MEDSPVSSGPRKNRWPGRVAVVSCCRLDPVAENTESFNLRGFEVTVASPHDLSPLVIEDARMPTFQPLSSSILSQSFVRQPS